MAKFVAFEVEDEPGESGKYKILINTDDISTIEPLKEMTKIRMKLGRVIYVLEDFNKVRDKL